MNHSRNNLFLTLAEHLSRQDENYLTQTLAAVFNTCPSFRSALTGKLSEKVRGLQAAGLDHLRIETQRGFTFKNERMVFDAVLVDTSRSKRWAVIEVKLDSPEGLGQYSRYRAAIERNVPFILLVKHVDEAVLEPYLILSWTSIYLVAEKAARGLGRNGFERTLLEAWMEFLNANGIVSPDPIPPASWGRVLAFAQLMAGVKRGHLDKPARTLDEMRSILARLELHRDILGERGWKPKGWKPYSLVWSDGKEGYCSVTAGFRDPKNWRYANQVEVRLYPRPPRLIVSKARGSWDTAKELQPNFDVKRVFSLPFDEAGSHIHKMMKSIRFS
jgi:hypothetical protein